MTEQPTRYEPPYLSVRVKKEESATPLFPVINVEITPEPTPISFILQTPAGDLTCTYDPAPLIGEIIHFFAGMISPPVSVLAEFMEELHCGKRKAKSVLNEIFCTRMQMCVATSCNYARENLEAYMNQSLMALLDDSINRTFAVRNTQAFIVKPVEGLIKGSIRNYNKRQRQLVNLKTRGGKRNLKHDWTDEECIELAMRYKQLAPDWKRATEIYKKHPNTYETELQKEMLIHLPRELVERLADRDKYVSMASILALEHAALEVGIKLGSYTARQLHRHKETGNSLISKKDFWTVKAWV